jgi:hypothetical protein
VSSEPFVVPDHGGVRVVLSTAPLPAAPAPTSRSMADDHLADGSIAVAVGLGGPAEPKPAGVAVALVGTAADDTVTVVTRATDAQGNVAFDRLDRTGATAYHVMAVVPRNGKTDRVVVPAVVLPATGGMRVTLAAGARAATTPPVDDLAKVTRQDVLPAGQLRVTLVGPADPTPEVDIVDAATGKAVAHATGTGDHVDVAAALRAGEVVYAETTAHGHRYRSLPFQPVAHAGTTAAIYVLPRVLPSYEVSARASDPDLEVTVMIRLADNAWAPYALADELPLPRGFTHAELADADLDASITATGIRLGRPVPPGQSRIAVTFRVPAHAGRVAWSLDLPYGAYHSSIAVVKEPGVTVTAPSTAHVDTQTTKDGETYAIDGLDILPHQAMTFDVTVPALPPVERACRKLQPDATPLAGKPAPALPATALDGKPVATALPAGKTAVVTFVASFVGVAEHEPATIALLAKAAPGVAAVLVYSDANPDDVRPLIDGKAGYRVVLDPPVGDQNIGPVTQAWGTQLLPESYLVDRKGVVRYYFANVRDWSTPEAVACVRALDGAR